MVSGRAWRTEFQKAGTVWPDRMRPEASVTVPEIMIGRRTRSGCSAKYWSIANSAALQLRVSKMVSTSSTSAPPSTRPRVCS